jgi:hypothetical protein
MNFAAPGSLSESWPPQCRAGVWDFHCRQTWRIINYPTLQTQKSVTKSNPFNISDSQGQTPNQLHCIIFSSVSSVPSVGYSRKQNSTKMRMSQNPEFSSKSNQKIYRFLSVFV